VDPERKASKKKDVRIRFGNRVRACHIVKIRVGESDGLTRFGGGERADGK